MGVFPRVNYCGHATHEALQGHNPRSIIVEKRETEEA